MTTTCEFIDAIKARYSLPSDYAASVKLGMTRAAVSSYRHRRSFLDDSAAIRVAELLEMEPGYVMACAHAERAKSDAERTAWQSIMQKLGGAAALVLIGLGGLSAPSPAQAAPVQASDGLCIMSNRRKGRRQHKTSTFAAVLDTLLPVRTIQQA